MLQKIGMADIKSLYVRKP